MSKIKIECTKEVFGFFKEGAKYEGFWDGDGYNEPKSFITIDDKGEEHIIAFDTLGDNWFKQHFKLV